jgi:hypothetical protein
VGPRNKCGDDSCVGVQAVFILKLIKRDQFIASKGFSP